MSDRKSHVAVLTMVLHIPLAHSLKEKRSVVKSLKEKLSNKFSLSVAEVADLDKWQKAIIQACIISSERKFSQEVLQKALSFTENVILGKAELTYHEIYFLPTFGLRKENQWQS